MREFVEEQCTFVSYELGCTYTDDLYSAFSAFCKAKGYKLRQDLAGFSRMFSAMYDNKIMKDRWREGHRNLNGYRGVILNLDKYDDDDWEYAEIPYYIDENGNKVINV